MIRSLQMEKKLRVQNLNDLRFLNSTNGAGSTQSLLELAVLIRQRNFIHQTNC